MGAALGLRARRQGQQLTAGGAAPPSLAAVQARLARRWGKPVGQAPLRFRVGALDVAVAAAGAGYRVTVGSRPGAGGIPTDLCVRRRTSRVVSSGRGDAADLVIVENCAFQLGDPAFDATLCLDGNPIAALPLLTPTVVRGLLRVNDLDLRDGVLGCEVGASAAGAQDAADAITAVLKVAEQLAAAGAADPAAQLELGAREHRNPATRLKMLQALGDRFPGGAALRRALTAAQADPAPILRLEACKALGAEGGPGLWALVQATDVPESLRVAAVIALGHIPGGFDAAPAQLEALFTQRGAQTLVAAVLRTLQRRPPQPLDSELAVRALAGAQEEVVFAACALLGDRADPRALAALHAIAADEGRPAFARRAAARTADAIAKKLAPGEHAQGTAPTLTPAQSTEGAPSLAEPSADEGSAPDSATGVSPPSRR